MSLHIVHFMRSINPDTLVGLQRVCLTAIEKGATEIRVHLSSNGGDCDEGFTIYNFLRSLPIKLTMQCVSHVESMAVIMFLAADKRVIVPHGKIKIHPMHWGFSNGKVDHNRLVEYVDSLDFDTNRYAEIFEERTTGSKNKVNVKKHLAGKAKLLNSNESILAGIATKISEVEIPKDAVIWWV